MKKKFLCINFCLALASVFYFAGCSDVPDNEENSSSALETVSLIPSVNGKADESSAYSIPKTTASIFPYFFYTAEDCKVPTSDIESSEKLYYDASQTSQEELNQLFGSASSETGNTSRAAENSENETIENLYIVGDLSLVGQYSNSAGNKFLRMEKDSTGGFYYELKYDNAMKGWGNGNGNASFKFVLKDDEKAEDNIWYGQTSVFETERYYLAKPHTTEKYDKNILLTGLKHGNTYKFVVSKITKDFLIFKIEGEFSETPTLQKGPFIRGVPTGFDYVNYKSGDWQYKKLSQSENGHYYDFTYSSAMEDKTFSSSIVFSIMPTNAYSLGSYGGEPLPEGGELSGTRGGVDSSFKTVYSTLENHNIILENLEDCHKYRINVSNPSAAKIEDNVYTVTFEDLGTDESAKPVEMLFYGLDGWQCRGTFNGWGYCNYNETDGEYWWYPNDETIMLSKTESNTYTFDFQAENGTEEFKISYGDWTYQYSGVNLSLENNAATMTKDLADSKISGLTKGDKYRLTFTCSETALKNNPGAVTVKIEEVK